MAAQQEWCCFVNNSVYPETMGPRLAITAKLPDLCRTRHPSGKVQNRQVGDQRASAVDRAKLGSSRQASCVAGTSAAVGV
ncbi:hypothetical protein GCM10023148_05280 [Actinokineospora soli]